YFKDNVPRQRLSIRLVNRRHNLITLRGVLRVARETNNLDLVQIVRTKTKTLSNRTLIWKMSFGKRLVHYSNWRSFRIVLRAERSPHQQRSLHGGQKILSYPMKLGFAFARL